MSSKIRVIGLMMIRVIDLMMIRMIGLMMCMYRGSCGEMIFSDSHSLFVLSYFIIFTDFSI